MDIINILIDEAAHYMKVDRGFVEFYAWPGTFSNTSGPVGGCGGQMMTSFTVFGLHNTLDDSGLLYCCGKWKKIKKFKPFVKW